MFSGGVDSTALLCFERHRRRGEVTHALVVNYGQRHFRELESAKAIAAMMDVPLTQVAVSAALRPVLDAGALTGCEAVPKGVSYEDPRQLATVVPNRNMILLSIALAFADARGLQWVSFGAHAGDHAVYRDCRLDFVEAMEKAAMLATGVALHAPFLHMRKHEVVKAGHELGAPYAATYSCYEGGAVHCGECGACVERREAFALAKVPDPTQWRS